MWSSLIHIPVCAHCGTFRKQSPYQSQFFFTTCTVHGRLRKRITLHTHWIYSNVYISGQTQIRFVDEMLWRWNRSIFLAAGAKELLVKNCQFYPLKEDAPNSFRPSYVVNVIQCWIFKTLCWCVHFWPSTLALNSMLTRYRIQLECTILLLTFSKLFFFIVNFEILTNSQLFYSGMSRGGCSKATLAHYPYLVLCIGNF